MFLLVGPEGQGPDETCIVMPLKPLDFGADFTGVLRAGLDERLRLAGQDDSTNRMNFRPCLFRRALSTSVELPSALDSYVKQVLVMAAYAAYVTLVPDGESHVYKCQCTIAQQ